LLLAFATSSKGSIVAEFQLMFRKIVATDETIADLRKEISDGKLGSLSVDPESLEQMPYATQGTFPVQSYSLSSRRCFLPCPTIRVGNNKNYVCRISS